MSIRDLRTFLAIAEEGSFVAAARTVRRTQSAITAQMRALETELGQTLFDRTKRPPILSEAGRALLPRAFDVVQSYDRFFREEGSSSVVGNLRLGVVPGAITGVMPRALVAMRAKYPQMHVDITMGLSKDLVERVHRGTVDAAIISDLLEGGAGLEWSPFLREPLVLIAPTDASGRKAEDLLGAYPFIRYSRQAWVGQIIDRFLKERKFRVNEAMTLDTLEAITTMVHFGLGVSIVPLRNGGEGLPQPVRICKFSGTPFHRVLGLIHAPNQSKKAMIEALLSELK